MHCDTVMLMDAQNSPPPPRPHRIVVNVDTVTLQAINDIAAMMRQSRSAVVAEVLQTFAPAFQPMARAIEVAKTKPAEAARLIREQVEAIHVVTGELVERARVDSRGSRVGADAAGGSADRRGGPDAGRGSRPPSK